MTEAEWVACTDPNQMLAWLKGLASPKNVRSSGGSPSGRRRRESKIGIRTSSRKLCLFASACCRRIWDGMKEEASRNAVVVLEQFADRRARLADLKTARDAAGEVAQLPSSEDPRSRPPVGSWYAARAACGAGKTEWDNALYTAWAAGAAAATADTRWDDPAWEKVLYAAWIRYNAECADRWDDFFWEASFELGWDDFVSFPGWVAERKAQASLLRDISGNPFRPVTIDRAWRTATAVAIAQAIYDERAFDRLPVLADALEDAGCDNADLLGHCRSPGPHVRGCWVVDLLLGKE